MSEEAKPGLLVTQSRLALVISMITLLTLGFQGSKFLLDFNHRISRLEERWTQMEGAQKDVASELRNLNRSITDLNLVLREIQVRQHDMER
jgi:hypothetical protein